MFLLDQIERQLPPAPARDPAAPTALGGIRVVDFSHFIAGPYATMMLAAQIQAARLLAVNTAVVVQDGEVPVHQGAMVKVFASELMESLSEAVFDLVGTGATLEGGATSALLDGRFEYAVRDALLYTIGGGTNEIQRTLIAQRGMGMPR
jgi:alkylation response protein AidB-like acyl-CoA dehydrogenase